MKKSRFLSGLAISMMAFVWLSPLANAQVNSSITARANDIVAGSPVQLKTSILPNHVDSAVFFVKQAQTGSVFRVYAEENEAYGIFEATLYSQQTQYAGSYELSVLVSGGQISPTSTFQVHSTSPSVSRSELQALNTLMQVGEVGVVEVKVVDEYLNPSSNQPIQLLSSSVGDSIYPIIEGRVGKVGELSETDAQGRAYFEIAPSQAGVSTLTALLPHTGQVLDDRLDVVVSEARVSSGIGGNFISNSGLFNANLTEGANDQPVAAGPVDRFEVDLPTNLVAGKDVSMTITAVDVNGLPTTFLGKIYIGVLGDDNANFAKEYTFTANDQGSHTFDLGFRPSTPGTLTVQAFSEDNFNLGGEIVVNVSAGGGGGNTTPAPSAFAPQIKTPSDGSVVSNAKLDVSGTMAAFSNGTLSVNGIQVENFASDGDGFFVVSAELGEGVNQISVSVQNLDGTSVSSAPVSVTVDTQPPALQSLTFTPESEGNVYKPGQAITVTLNSGQLDSGKVIVQGIDYPLNPGVDAGSYATTFAAPSQSGEYSLQVILVDELFNESQYTSPITFKVEEEIISVIPNKVKGFKGIGGDESLSLQWSPVVDAEGYVVKYGFSFDRLTETLDVPAGETSFTLSNLVNGETYYVNVSAKNIQGELGDPSVILAIKPKEPAPEEAPMPEIMEPEVVEVFTGQAPTPVVITPVQSSLHVVPAQDGVILQFNVGNNLPLGFDPQQISGYNIYLGLNSGQYTDSYFVQGNVNEAVIPDLIAGLPYYFAAVPVDSSGREMGSIFPEASGVPGSGVLGANLLPAATGGPDPAFLNNDTLAAVDQNTNSGPEAIWIVLISLVVSPLFYLYRRKVRS